MGLRLLFTVAIIIWTIAIVRHQTTNAQSTLTKPDYAYQVAEQTLITSSAPKTVVAFANVKSVKRNIRSKGNCALYAKAKTGIVTGAPVARLTLAYAKKAGYETTKNEPVVGAIGQTTEGPVGHVFVVEKVEEGRVLTSEENYPVKSRWVDIDNPILKGFILPK